MAEGAGCGLQGTGDARRRCAWQVDCFQHQTEAASSNHKPSSLTFALLCAGMRTLSHIVLLAVTNPIASFIPNLTCMPCHSIILYPAVRRYADPQSPKKQPELVQQADGLFVRHLPAALLREMNIVDTPGTNVILERQQRLTEEYVPRADLVLFVLSADRPLSESELAFLKYIRQWRKKVVFVVNKVGIALPTSQK